MSEPPFTTPPASANALARRGFTRRNALLIVLMTLALSASYLLIDIALDPALLPHAARAGRLPVLLVLVGVGFVLSLGVRMELETKRSRVEKALNVLAGLLSSPAFPIWSMAWIETNLPNLQAIEVAATGFGLLLIGLVLCIPSLAYGLQMARQRNATTDSVSGAHSDLQIVGLRSAIWIAASAWSFLLVVAITYAMWSTLTSSMLDSRLFVPLAIFASAFIIVMVTFFWLWFRARRYARQTGDAVLLFSTGQFSSTRATSQRVMAPPEERPRWSIALLLGLGLIVLSLLTFTVLDFNFIQSVFSEDGQQWRIVLLFPFFSWAGFHRVSVRRYQPARFWRMFVAAALFVVAGAALLLDMTHPHHSIVPPIGLLAIAVLCSTLGVLICRSLLLRPMWEGNIDPNGALSPDFAQPHEATLAGGQKRPHAAPYVMLVQPLLFVAAHLFAYGDAAMRKESGIALIVVSLSILFSLAVVVNTDMPLPQAQRPAKQGS